MTEPDAYPSRADTAAAAPAGSLPDEGAASSLPVDPLRLLAGLWKRRNGVIFACLAGTLMGLTGGVLKSKTRYKAGVQLIKRDMPSAFRIGEAGEAFKPHQLSGGTLVGTASAPEVLQRVAAKASLPLSELQGSTEVAEQRNTDFVFLTLSTYKSREAAAEIANLWAREVVQFTRDLQCQESHEIRQFLQTQVDSTDAELTKLRERILEFSKREDLVDADKQVTSSLSSLGEVDLKYQTARIDLDTLQFKINGLEAELRRQSPLAEKLRTAQAELDDLRSQYTDKNPVIIEKLAKLEALQSQLKQASKDTRTDLSSYAGTFLGNTLYLEVVKFRNEAKALEKEIEEYDRLRAEARARLNAIPEKAAAFAQLALRKQSLEMARNLLFSRLREAQLFEEDSPGYYRIFSPASPERVEVRNKFTKTALFAAGGGIFFAVLGLAAALGRELLDPKLRTAWEAAKTFRVPLFGTIPRRGAPETLGPELWARWVGANRNPRQPRIVWSPCPGPNDSLFWDLLLSRASSLLTSLQIIDFGSPSLVPPHLENVCVERIDARQYSIEQAQQLGTRIREDSKNAREVWIRLAGPVHEPLTTLARCGLPALVLVSLHSETTEFWKTQAELLAKTVSPPAGVVSVGEIPWRQWT